VQADGVFSGGGIKGLAFAGALEVAEETGYTDWVQLAGTSAGAITAMALAVGYSAKELRERLEAYDFKKIADYGAPLGIGEAENLLLRRGLTHGKGLHEWIVELLAQAPRPAKTFGELEGENRLRVIGTDLAHERMVVFPEDVVLYADDDGRPYTPDAFPIADAVRISAGYPYFFPPVTLRTRPPAKTARSSTAASSALIRCSCSTRSSRTTQRGASGCSAACHQKRPPTSRSTGRRGRSTCSKACSTPRSTRSTSLK
jgi:NTE family protein